jgi:preprotein translocase subunit SecE
MLQDDMDKIKAVISTSRQFLMEARTELSKVTWPTTKQAIASTSVVLVVVLVVSLVLGIFDFGLAKMIRLILG